jgi:hypothetical protein
VMFRPLGTIAPAEDLGISSASNFFDIVDRANPPDED